MGKNYDTDAELRTIDVWVCLTCGRIWPQDLAEPSIDAEVAVRRCCAENAPCRLCGIERAPNYYRACDTCRAKLDRQRWEACEVRPLEFPLTLQDDDRWFYDLDNLFDYCEEHGVQPADLLLRIGVRVKPRLFEPWDFWENSIAEDDDPFDDPECQALAEKLNNWAKEHIVLWEMGPFRPDVSGLELR